MYNASPLLKSDNDIKELKNAKRVLNEAYEHHREWLAHELHKLRWCVRGLANHVNTEKKPEC